MSMHANFAQEWNNSPELDLNEVYYYQKLIKILHLATKIGYINILHKALILSHYQAMLWHNHMNKMLHIFAYLKCIPKLTLYFNL